MSEIIIVQQEVKASIHVAGRGFTITVAGANVHGFHVSQPPASTTRQTSSIQIPAESIIEVISWVGRNSTAARGQLDLQIVDFNTGKASTFNWVKPVSILDEVIIKAPFKIKLAASSMFLLGAEDCVVGDLLQTTMMINLLRRGLG